MPNRRLPVLRLSPCIVLTALLPWMALSVQAQAPATGIYRCGSGYSDTPCPGGTPVAADDTRSAAQLEQAREVKRREAALADRLAAERRVQERAAAGQRAAGIGPTAAETAQRAASQPKARPTQKPKKKIVRKPKTARPT